MDIKDEINNHRKKISTDTYTTTWRELITQFKEKEIRINPEYQRLFRWTTDQQTQFIESILLGIPSPAIFLAENEDGTQEVLDGLQRISTILKFYSEEIGEDKKQERNETQKSEEENTDNDISCPSILNSGPIIKSLEGASASNIPEVLNRTIKTARVTVILLQRESERQARIEVFRRLNRFGSILSDQEIRNATSRLIGSSFADELIELSSFQEIHDATGLNQASTNKRGVEELVLRLLAFNYSNEPLKHDVAEFLDRFMIYASEGNFVITEKIKEDIKKTFNEINKAFHDGKAFRHQRSGFSTNLFDVVASGVYHNISTLDSTSIKTKHASLMESTEIRELTGAGSNTRKKLQGRIDLGKEWFKNDH